MSEMVERVARAIYEVDPANRTTSGHIRLSWENPRWLPEAKDVWRNKARAAIEAMRAWQPIETAPKDGTAIWLLVDGHPHIGYCEPADNSFRERDVWFVKASFRRGNGKPRIPDEIFGCYGFDVAPTHWMPLPDPPTPPGPEA